MAGPLKGIFVCIRIATFLFSNIYVLVIECERRTKSHHGDIYYPVTGSWLYLSGFQREQILFLLAEDTFSGEFWKGFVYELCTDVRNIYLITVYLAKH